MINKNLRFTIAVAAVMLMAAGCNNNNNSTSQTAPQTNGQASTQTQPDTVLIQDFNFQTPQLAVKKGTTVTWMNKDSARHNVVGDNGKGPQSELLSQGQSYTYTFNEAGSFSYKCEPHPYMKGTVTVTD